MDHEEYMLQCLALAQRGRGHTVPNPMVGAVLVYKDVVIGEGWHHVYGGDHAEVNCLNSVDEADRHLIPECTMYVNLEPCAHHGHTPPCAVRLVEEKVKEVVIANADPFDKVNGQGIAIMEAGGIKVTTGVLAGHGLWLNRRFFCFHAHKRPYIILKWAQTADGFFAPADRTRFQITGAYSQMLVHKWRTEEAAIMVGTTTAINDDPQLTARLVPGRQPLRIVLDRVLQVPDTHQVFDNAAPTWIVNEIQQKSKSHIHYIKLSSGQTLLSQLMNKLYISGIQSVIIEGGAHLLQGFIDQELWDEARVFTGVPELGQGLPAPVLRHADVSFKTFVEHDSLSIFTRQNSPFTYIQGMEL